MTEPVSDQPIDASHPLDRQSMHPLAPYASRVSDTIAQKIAQRPVTAAALCILIGALAANGAALIVSRSRMRRAQQQAALSDMELRYSRHRGN